MTDEIKTVAIIEGQRKARVPAQRQFSPIFASAAIFALFFACGVALYLALSPDYQAHNVPHATLRFSLLAAIPSSPVGVLKLLLSATKSDAFFLALSFLFSLSFFAKPMIHALLVLRAMQIGAALCRLLDWMQSGAFSPAVYAAFLLCEAGISTLLVVFASRSISVSRKFCLCDKIRPLPAFISFLLHFLYLILAYFMTVFTVGILFLIAQL